MSLESGYTATIVVHRPDGDLRLVMETWEDAGAGSEEAKHRNPVTRKVTARGGLQTRDNLKLTRECDAEVWAVLRDLEDSRGKDRCTCIRQMVGPRTEAIGAPLTLTGVLITVNAPNYDLSGDGVGMLELEVSTDSEAA